MVFRVSDLQRSCSCALAIDGALISQRAAKLGYASRARSPSRRRHQRLLSAVANLVAAREATPVGRPPLREHPARLGPPGASKSPVRAAQATHRRAQAVPLVSYLSPALAGPTILNGLADLIATHRRDAHENLPRLGASFGRAVLEDAPALNIRELVSGGHIEAGKIGAWRAAFDLPDGCKAEGFGATDCRYSDAAYAAIRIAIRRDGHVTEYVQVIELAARDNADRPRWRFINADHSKFAEVLYWRAGRFAEAATQRLAHRSQFRPPRVAP